MCYLPKIVQFIPMFKTLMCCICIIFKYVYRKYLIYNQLFEC